MPLASPAPPPARLVVFAHGKESGPWGTKITHLAALARARGWAVESHDYTFTTDPRARVAHLLDLAPRAATLLLVGSSMGGYVMAQATPALDPAGLFLMAPALYFDGWAEEPASAAPDTAVVHGWHDDIVPWERGRRYAERHAARLHVLDAGHTLNERLDEVGELFVAQLARLESREPA